MNRIDGWIDKYYLKVTNEARFAIDRRDKNTNWALTILAALVSIYFGAFSGKIVIPDYWRFALVIAFLIIEIRFFSQSMQSYAYVTKWRKLQVEIELYWESGATRWESLMEAVKKYDHGNRVPTSYQKMISAQIRGGFALILAIPTALLINEWILSGATVSNDYVYPLLLLLVYVIWEIILFANYKPMKKPKKKEDFVI